VRARRVCSPAARRLLLSALLLPALPASAAENLPGGPLAGPLAPSLPPESLPLPLEEVRIFTEVFNQIRSAYVEPIDDRTLLEIAIAGRLARIEPHATYLARDDFIALQESTTGEFGGLGVEVGIEDGYIKVIAPLEDSPADRAGIQAGDLIIKLNDT